MEQADRRVLVALSGGVDSAVCVQLLREAGYEVAALVLRFSDAHENAVAAAQAAADQLGVPLTVRDCADDFRRKVIAPFCADYCAGRTPNPCLICNPLVKFHLLCEVADELGIFWVASGHYARIARQGDFYFPRRAVSEARDQSYMLYRLPQSVLRRLLLPVGEYEKPEIRARAAAAGLAAADAPDSQEICFIPDGDYADYIERAGYHAAAGRFIAPDGTPLGPHKGVLRYTVGQRRGLGIALGRPVFVRRILPNGDILLGEAGEEFYAAVSLSDLVEHGGGLQVGGQYTVKIRSAAKPAPCRVLRRTAGGLLLGFDEPVRAPAPGQAAVLYQGGLVVGGGPIDEIYSQLPDPV